MYYVFETPTSIQYSHKDLTNQHWNLKSSLAIEKE